MAPRKRKEQQPEESAPEQTAVEGTTQVQQRVATQTQKGNHTMTDMPSIIEYDVDLAEQEAPPVLPVGDYPATIRSAEQKTSGKGNKYVNVTFMIDPESYPADFVDGDEDGTILSYGRISPENTQRARWGMRKFQEAIGAKLSKQVDLNDWIGLSAVVSVGHEPYEGENRAKITKVNPA